MMMGLHMGVKLDEKLEPTKDGYLVAMKADWWDLSLV